MTTNLDAARTRRNSAGFAIQRLSGQVCDDMAEELAPLGLTLGQFAVLMTVLEEDGLSQVEIGAKFRTPAYAISRAIDALEQQGRLVRRVNPQKRQAHRIFVTDAARALAPQMFAIVARVNAALLAPLSAAEQVQFLELLSRLRTHSAAD